MSSHTLLNMIQDHPWAQIDPDAAWIEDFLHAVRRALSSFRESSPHAHATHPPTARVPHPPHKHPPAAPTRAPH